MLIEKKSSYMVGLVVGIIVYILMAWLLIHDGGPRRIHWLGALLLGIGGPHMLSVFCGLIGGFMAALCYEVKSYEWDEKKSSNALDRTSVCKSTSTIMANFLQEVGIYETPLKFMKPPVLAYLYGWCDATVQIQKPSPTEGLAMMVAMFDDIYGRIMFADGTTSPETSAIAYKQALKIVKNPNDRYASWVIMGGNELNALLSSGTPPMGILEALDAPI